MKRPLILAVNCVFFLSCGVDVAEPKTQAVRSQSLEREEAQSATENSTAIRYLGNTACPLLGGLVPGSIASIVGSGLTPNHCKADGFFMSNLDNRLSTRLCDTVVHVGQKQGGANVSYEQVSLFRVSPEEIQFHVPSRLSTANGPVYVSISQVKMQVAEHVTSVRDQQLCVFSQFEQTAGASALFGRFQVVEPTTGALQTVSAQNPAKPGDWVVAYATGAGNTTLPLKNGHATPLDAFYGSTSKPRLSYFDLNTFQEVSFEPLSYQGLFTLRTPGLVGTDQIMFRIPQTARADADGNLSLTVGETDVFLWFQNVSP